MILNLNLSKIYLNINYFLECTEVEGPGKRFCIWLQGCNIGCKNCINQEMLSFEPKTLLSIEALFKIIENSQKLYNIEGITFLGGEPFLQAHNLAYLAEKCQKIDLSVLCFSGFKFNSLKKNILNGSQALLSNIDILIDDVYIEELKDDSRNWVGSTNQKFYYLTNKYKPDIEYNKTYKNKIEIRYDNSIFINGEADMIKYFKE